MKNILFKINKQQSEVKSQKGSVQVFIILVVILIAFLLAGGEFLLGSAFPLPDSLGIGSGGGTPVGSGNGGSASANGITIQNKGCVGTGPTAKSATTVIVTSDKSGYISLEISNGAGGFASVDTHEFKNLPTSVYELELPNELGFNTSPWRVRLFEGGTQTNGSFSGGVEKEVKDSSATGC